MTAWLRKLSEIAVARRYRRAHGFNRKPSAAEIAALAERVAPKGNPTVTMTEFLLARIGDEQAAWSQTTDLATQPDFTKLSRHMLADLEAKRRIVELHSGGSPICMWTHDSMEMHDDEHPCVTLRLLAAAYADHPDYRTEWGTEQ